jgi:hypothetical protein
MENNKALTPDQLNSLKTLIRQRFDDLYHRIGTNRQKLATTVLLVDQAINKEFAKEQIDAVAERQILNRVRDIEKVANNQLPHLHKTVVPAPAAAQPLAAKPSPAKPAPVKTAPLNAPAAKTPPAKKPSAKAPATKSPATKAPAAKAKTKAKPTKTKSKKKK